MAIVWPYNILPPQSPRPHYLSPMNISGPVSQNALSDIISGDAGFWRASYGSIVVNTPQRVRVWNAIRALLQGRLNPIVIPYFGDGYKPLVDAYSGDEIPHDNGQPFSNGEGYLPGGTAVYTTADLAVRAVSCTVNVIASDFLEPGARFSFGERLYEITNVIDGSDSLKTISFMPPLREPVLAGTELNFTRPVCRMRLATDDAMQIDLDLNRRGFPSLDFVEDLAP